MAFSIGFLSKNFSPKETRTRPSLLRASNSGAYFLSQRCEVRTGLKDSFEERQHFVIEHIGRYQGILAIVEFFEAIKTIATIAHYLARLTDVA